MKRLEGKVAYITGVARGQGRSHAIRFAEEGADIIGIDICSDIQTVPYPGATKADLAETVELIEGLGQRMVAHLADVRDVDSLRAAADDGREKFGHIDVIIANAGIVSYAPILDIDEPTWQAVLDINLTGVWKTMKAVVPALVERNKGGSVIVTSSVLGSFAMPNLGHYVAAKHGVTGLMRSLALELAPHDIRVNSVHPSTVETPMILNEASLRLFTGGQGEYTGGSGGRHDTNECVASRSMAPADRRQQCRVVSGLRRESVRHRHHHGHRRRGKRAGQNGLTHPSAQLRRTMATPVIADHLGV
jgi:SDR family mycofactocin-dependent oxidoreductase